MKKITIKNLLMRYKHAWVLLYFLVYMVWFMYLEGRSNVKFYPIHSRLDDMIPFCEYFVVPYLLWFLYIVVVMAYFFFTNVTDFYKASIYLFGSMTFCLFLFTFAPTEQLLRPTVFPRDNIFTELVKFIYTSDSNANVCPSIHVLNSIAIFLAMLENKKLSKHKVLMTAAGILSFSICLSTVFIKQHSAIDVFCGTALALVAYSLVYKVNYPQLWASLKSYRPKSPKKIN